MNGFDDVLRELLSLTLDERRDAVANDVLLESPRYREIPGRELAEALGVPQPERPSNEWSFTSYARVVSVEEYARDREPASEFVFLIEGLVEPDRFESLLALSESVDQDEPDFSFLLKEERDLLEHQIAERQLESNQDNGLCCIARISIQAPCGSVLEFEGDIEDDGFCWHLRTPYDKVAGRFLDLSNCMTHSW